MASYFTLGLDKTGWCSDRNVQGRCKPLVNICKPMDHAALDKFKTLQRLLNRGLSVNKLPLLEVDGRIGPLTMQALSKVAGFTSQHCDEASASVETLIGQLSVKYAGVAQPPDPGGSRPSIPLPDGSVQHPDTKQAGFGALIQSPLGIAALIVGGILLYRATKPPKKKRKARRKPERRVIQTWY